MISGWAGGPKNVTKLQHMVEKDSVQLVQTNCVRVANLKDSFNCHMMCMTAIDAPMNIPVDTSFPRFEDIIPRIKPKHSSMPGAW